MKRLCPVCGHTAYQPLLVLTGQEYDPVTDELSCEIRTSSYTCPICSVPLMITGTVECANENEDACGDPAVDLFRRVHDLSNLGVCEQYARGWDAAIAAVENLLVERLGVSWDDLEENETDE